MYVSPLTVESAVPLKNCTGKVSILFRLLISCTPIGIVVIDAQATKDAGGDDFPTRKCATEAPLRLNAAHNDVVFPVNTYSTKSVSLYTI